MTRDHTGERPLFYASATAGSFRLRVDAQRSARPCRSWARRSNEDYIARYLTLANIRVERTVFLHMLRLPAGCALSVRRGATRLWRHWQTDQLNDLRKASPQAYLESFRELFDEAVRARLRTRGGHVGAQLSGGLDSGSVAAAAAHLLAGQNRELTCFTAVPRPGFAGPDDEREAAAELAALYPNMHHVLVESSQTSFLDILDHNNNLYDHPCFGPSNEVWGNAIFDRARPRRNHCSTQREQRQRNLQLRRNAGSLQMVSFRSMVDPGPRGTATGKRRQCFSTSHSAQYHRTISALVDKTHRRSAPARLLA